MKKVLSLVLIGALGFQCLSKLSLIAYYNINLEYIIQELCENKDKPQLNCKGKCYLKKKLEESNKAENQASGSIKQFELPVFICNQENFEFALNQEVITQVQFPKDLYSLTLNQSFFHPPRFSVKA